MLVRYLNDTSGSKKEISSSDHGTKYSIGTDDLARTLRSRDLSMANLNEDEENMIDS